MKKILIIDDDKNSLSVLSCMLKNNYDITSTFDSWNAVNILNKNNFEIVITDICMPVINGFEILGVAKQRNRETRVIAMSSSFQEKDRKMFLEKGFFDFFEKPFQKERVFKIIERAIK